MKQTEYNHLFLVASVYLFCFTLIFIPLFSTGALLLFGIALWLNKEKLGRFSISKIEAFLIASSVIFAVLHANSLIQGDYSRAAQFQFEKKLSFLLIPTLLIPISNKKSIIPLFKQAWVYCIIASLVICLFIAAYASIKLGNVDSFFYHALGKPFKLTATYYSFMVSIAVFFLWTDREHVFKPHTKKYFYTLLLTGLFLLSARMLQLSMALIFVVQIPVLAFKPKQIFVALGLLAVLIVVGINSSVGNRYKELLGNNLEVLEKSDVGRDYNFNGLNLRLFLWKCGLEILKENNLLNTGTGSAKSQEELNKKIINYNLYQGVQKSKDRGFLNYNFHNQYLETTIKTGIWGLLDLLVLLILSIVYSKKELKYVIILLLFLLCTESMLEMQQGAVLSSFLIGLFAKNSDS